MRLSIRAKLVYLPVCVLIAVIGCGGGADNKSKDNAAANVITVPVTIDDTANYAVESACIGNALSDSSYIYGLVKVTYKGSSPVSSILIESDFKSGSTVLFEDTSFVETSKIVKYPSIDSNNNSYFDSAGDTGYYFIIKDLADCNADIDDITGIDIKISGDACTYIAPIGKIEVQGAASSIDNSISVNVSRTDADSMLIHSKYSRFIFVDTDGNTFKWAFPEVYNGSVVDYNFAAGDTRKYEARYCSPDYTEVTLSECLLEWDAGSYSGVSKKINSIMRDSGCSRDEKNLRIRNALDEETAALRKKLHR